MCLLSIFKNVRTKTYVPHCVCILMLCVEPEQHSLLDNDSSNTRNIPAHHKFAVIFLGALAYS
jgi:hypothetical protein